MHTIRRNDDAIDAITHGRNWRNRNGSMSGRYLDPPTGSVSDVSVLCESDPERGDVLPGLRVWDDSGMFVVPTGSLPLEWANRLRDDYLRSDTGLYVVRSYATPIGWTDPGSTSSQTWTVPPLRYSLTTTQHQWTCFPWIRWNHYASPARSGKGRSPYGPRGVRNSTDPVTGEAVLRVVFRKFPDGDVIALFPDVSEGYREIMSYMHVGQHGPARSTLTGELFPAEQTEYEPLLRELERIGYRLHVVDTEPGKVIAPSTY